MKKESSVWKLFKKDMKELLNPWTWLMAIVTTVIVSIISYFTGWKVENIIASFYIPLIGTSLLWLGIILIKNKIKKGRWFYED